MKKIIRLITLGATAAMLALPVAAKSLVNYSDISVQDQCSSENKDAYYAAFLENRKTDQPKAYDNAKKYLACPPGGEVTEATQKIIDYLKKWSTAYDEGSRKSKLPALLYNEHKYPEAYALGRELLAADPENLKVLIDLGANGYLVTSLNQPQLNTDALNAAKKALGMLEAGKTVDDWAPLSGKDEAMAYLNYTIGVFTLQSDPSTALKNLIKAAQFETPLKKSPQTYAYIGGSYELGPYAKLSDEYTTKYKGQNETPESKLALANINQVVDRMVDAYARAVNLAGSDSKLATQKATWTERLTEWYKYRHNQTTDGMNEMVAGVLSKPLPPEPTPLTSLPAEPATTPIGNSGTTASTTAATQPANGNKPATARTGTPDKPKNK